MSATILKCGDEGSEACPGDWRRLDPTGDQSIRYCQMCMRTVFACSNEEEIEARKEAGQCVALVE